MIRLCFLISVLSVFWGCARLNTAHREACSRLVIMSQNLDSFFAEPRELEEYEKSRIILSGGVFFRENGEIKLSGQNQLKLELPALKNRFGLLIGGSSDREEIPPEDIENISDGQYESFVRVYNKQPSLIDWDVDVGAKYNNGAQVFARIKAQYDGVLGIFSYRLIERVYWTNQFGFGEKSRMEIDQPVGAEAVMREFFEVEWSETSQGLGLVAGIYLRKKLTVDSGISFEWIHYGATNPWDYKYFDFYTRYRKSIFWNWLELELAPRFRFYREKGIAYNVSPAIEFRFNLIFDAEHVMD